MAPGRWRQGGFTAPDLPISSELGARRGRASACSPGPATPRTARPTRRVDWVTALRGGDRLPGRRQVLRHLGRGRTACSRPVSTTSCPRRATRRCGSSSAAMRSRSTPTWSPNYADIFGRPQGQALELRRRHRRTAYRTAGAPTCSCTTPTWSRPPPTSWSAVFDDASPSGGKVTAVRLAHLHRRRRGVPDGDAARSRHREPLRARRGPARGCRRSAQAAEASTSASTGPTTSRRSRPSRPAPRCVGTYAGRSSSNLAHAEAAPVEAILPDEGATGWSDTWMIHSETEHPNCAYLWLEPHRLPRGQRAVAEWFGEAPANPKACDLTKDTEHCETYHAGDEAYAEQIYYWTTPIEECLDGRTDVKCTDYAGLDAGLDRDQGLSAWTSRPRSGPRRGGPRPAACCTATRVCGSRLLLGPPMLWLVVLYLGSLAALLITAFWTVDTLHQRHRARLDTSTTSGTSFTIDVYRTITRPHAVGVAAAGDADRRASSRSRWRSSWPRSPRPGCSRCSWSPCCSPLWASLPGQGLRVAGHPRPTGGLLEEPFGLVTRATAWPPRSCTLAYLWLPYMMLPIYAGLERLPNSLLEASGDLGREGLCTTLRRVVFPVMLPAIVAGSIFTFSLTLGDYIAVQDRRWHHPDARQHRLRNVLRRQQSAVRGARRDDPGA